MSAKGPEGQSENGVTASGLFTAHSGGDYERMNSHFLRRYNNSTIEVNLQLAGELSY